MQFQVPQFIETEDKIIGPLTLKQFLYLAVAGGICFVLFFFLTTVLWIFVSAILFGIAAAFAFISVNGRPLSVAAISALSFYWKPRMYLWQRTAEAPKLPTVTAPAVPGQTLKSRLDNLWEQLKTSKAPIPQREKPIEAVITDQAKSSKERFEMMRKITGEREVARRVDYK
jgi:hypothetical protein